MVAMTGSRTVLITGGSAGLGRALARHFVIGGDTVYVCGRNEATLAEAIREVPEIRGVRADVSVAGDRIGLLEQVTRDGSLDVLVNNAAIARAHDYTNPFTLASDRAAEELAINLAAPIELTRLFLRWRLESGRAHDPATIAMISSPAGLLPLEANPLYSTTKAGLHSFTLSLRWQLRDTPVTVVEVFPPALATNLTPDLDVPSEADGGPEVIDEVARKTVDAIDAGERVVLPHPQAEALYRSFGRTFDDEMMARINTGAIRRPGWDQE